LGGSAAFLTVFVMVVCSLDPPLFGIEGAGVKAVADFLVEDPFSGVLRVGVGRLGSKIRGTSQDERCEEQDGLFAAGEHVSFRLLLFCCQRSNSTMRSRFKRSSRRLL
jgi:hypothetical protein